MPHRSTRPSLAALLTFALLAGCGGQGGTHPGIYVPSPDWRDQVIYFVVTDRFYDGVPANDDLGMGELDPNDGRKYQGGDLVGLRAGLDYIQGLGATAVWVTPPVANQWWDEATQQGGYDGYRARNFGLVDDHLGNVGTYRDLAIDLHQRGMYLVQDIVVNHVGNFFTYDPGLYDPANPSAGYGVNGGSVPTTTPTLAPFDENDPRDPAQLADGIYHWTPPIGDGTDATQALTYQVDDLDDLATENPAVRSALASEYAFWIRAAGVDAFGVSNAVNVEQSFWSDFLHGPDGILKTAVATGKDDFMTFGDALVGSSPLDDSGDRQAIAYLGTPETPGLGAVLDVPLCTTLRALFADGAPTHDLGYRLEVRQRLYPDVNRLPTFIEDQDTARLLASSTPGKAREALLLLLSLPGVPIIYYGAEQGLAEARGSMFATGWGSGGVDHFDTSGGMYRLVHDAVALRLAHEALRRGSVTVLADDATGPGLFAFRRDGESESVVGLFNTGDTPVLADVDTGLAPGTTLTVGVATGVDGVQALTVDSLGKVALELPGEAAVVAYGTSAR